MIYFMIWDIILSKERGYSWASEGAEQNKWH